jgi:hypothetical protein
LIAQAGVDGIFAEPDPKVGRAEVRTFDHPDPIAVQRQLRSNAGNVGERVAVARLDVAVEGVDPIEPRAQGRQRIVALVAREGYDTAQIRKVPQRWDDAVPPVTSAR